ncbi:hypothetical protein A8L34_03225 [Bacillus sp. FJAT-27264]|uniref:DinB family protein n=1 Tax=Paenibacillus sp. (strain DSM 101736 / FJAT-27264) TaxID=1850362 RepID=UPI000807B236|nr:DinB family protein [Bacillus sp. FJAT-27264]OBZ18597.1 hypothetical protein A8L34_03225 [Bacillus sp. FJAT-27264]
MAVKTNEQMVLEFQSFLPFVESLKEAPEAHWTTPIGEGKWTVKDIICHIMLWDKYFYEEAIEKIKLGQPLTSRHLDFNEFNANAVEHAKSLSALQVAEDCILQRTRILDTITGLTEEEYIQEYKDGDRKKFSIRKHLRGFLPHDKHHRKQIETFFKGLK